MYALLQHIATMCLRKFAATAAHNSKLCLKARNKKREKMTDPVALVGWDATLFVDRSYLRLNAYALAKIMLQTRIITDNCRTFVLSRRVDTIPRAIRAVFDLVYLDEASTLFTRVDTVTVIVNGVRKLVVRKDAHYAPTERNLTPVREVMVMNGRIFVEHDPKSHKRNKNIPKAK